jgi:hypothetical protein
MVPLDRESRYEPAAPVEGYGMQARRLIEGASFGPETLKVVFEAFDQAWAALAPRYGANALAAEAARTRLANILLGLVRQDSRDAGALRDAALRSYEAVAADRKP